MSRELPYAEEVNYWKTGTTAPDTILDNACKEVAKAGGTIMASAIGMMAGKAAIMMQFELGGAVHRITWPILDTSKGDVNTAAARRQAASFVFHDMKARALQFKVIGQAAYADLRLIPGTNATARECLYEGNPSDLKLLEAK